MNIWGSLRNLFGIDSTTRSNKVRKGKHMQELKPRNHMIEQCEDRVLLSVSPITGLDEIYGSTAIQQAIITASNLDNYQSDTLSNVTKWVVGLDSKYDATSLANKYGATNQGETLLTNSYIWEFTTNTSWETAASYMQSMTGVDYFYPLVPLNLKTMDLSDPLYQYQWNLTSFNATSAGINAEGAWLLATGNGVTVAVVDQGTEYTHEDLANNSDASLGYDYIHKDADPAPVDPSENHGTAVSGIIGADNNTVGGVGVAYDSTLTSIRLIGNDENSQYTTITAEQEASALTLNLDKIDIYNNSWGNYLADYQYGIMWSHVAINPLTQAAFEKGVTEGRDGKGAIYVFAAGNEGDFNIDTNYTGYTNSRYTITVGAVNPDGTVCSYSNQGASLLIAAPSGGDYNYDTQTSTDGTTTTDRTGTVGYNDGKSTTGDYKDGNYTNTFNGTSAATPVVSGVIALMLEANPNLTWRDVQNILVDTAVKTDSTDSGWATNGAGKNINYKYGFGLVNADAAVKAAQSWTNVGEEQNITVTSTDMITIGSAYSTKINVSDKSISSLETVEITLDIVHAQEGDLQIELVSPDGTSSILARTRNVLQSDGGYDNYTFSTTRCWGEAGTGDWTLNIIDNGNRQNGVLKGITLNLYGTDTTVAAVGPDIVAVFPDAGDSLLENPALTYAPEQLTIRFTEGQSINPDTLDAIKLMYRPTDSSAWTEVSIGWIGLGDAANEVIVRPASTFQDGFYQLVIYGQVTNGIAPLTNDHNYEFRYDSETETGSNYTLDFSMDLPVQVTAVVPMPVADGVVQSDTIEVYFSADKTDNTNFETVDYYTLIATKDTETSNDDLTVHPVSVTLDTVTDASSKAVMRATLTFADDINKLITDGGNAVYGSYRLKVGETYDKGTTTAYEPVDGEDYEALDTFAGATTLTENFANVLDKYTSLVVSGNIDAALAGYEYNNRWPGGNDEPGHELRTTANESVTNVEQHILNWDFDSYDAEAGVVTFFYCFPKAGNGFSNYITDQQKDSIREIFQLMGDYCGLQFFELKTPDDGSMPTTATYKGVDFPVISFFVADLGVLGGNSGPGGVAGLGGGTTAVLDLADYGNSTECEYGSGFYGVAMHEIMHCLGLGHSYDLDGATIMGSSEKAEFYEGSEEDVYPAPADIVHLQYLYRNDSCDVDMYKFHLGQKGTLELETIAQRLTASSGLDTLLQLYDANGTLIATNDNYFGTDSLIEVSLEAGDYYVGVSSTGNNDYDPVIENSGMNGNTEGEYQLKLSFTPAQKASQLLNFDGNMDGSVGGDFNFWFDVQADENVLYVDKTGAFTPANGTAVYTGIDDALAAAEQMVKGFTDDSRVVVRILANNTDNADLTKRQAYEVGSYTTGGKVTSLTDGETMNIPKGVAVVIEEGVVIKLVNTNITAGSVTAVGLVGNELDQTPAGTIQLLGTPDQKVYLTSYWDENIGTDNYKQTTQPKAGDWGGIVLTNTKEHDYNASEAASKYGKVTILEDEGIYLNYIGFSDISYGGGIINVNGVKSTYAPVYLDESRPTILSNTITSSMTAAISADPNSFEESHFYGLDENGALYTADYDRVGPSIHNNTLVKTHDVKKVDVTGEVITETVVSANSVNGLALRCVTPNTEEMIKLDVTARFDDWDIAHVIQEDLVIAGNTGGAIMYIDSAGKAFFNNRVGGSLRINDKVVVKLANTRIELENNAGLIAEGSKGNEIVFTSLYDDKYGYGGTFDTSNNGFNTTDPDKNDYLTGGNWAGLYIGASSTASLDYVKFMYAGGTSKIEGTFVNFQPIEVVQADLRVSNSYFAYNAAVTETSTRVGRGSIVNPAVIYVRNAQPIIVGNNFAENDSAIISINANALTAEVIVDSGKQTGLLISQDEGASYTGLYSEYSDNYGPMVRDNLFNNNLTNGMVVRGEVLTTETIWDDVDIVHVLYNEVVVGNHHTYSGVRLQSSTTGSLVVKLNGANAGLTAAGSPNDTEDRIGGTVQVIGNAAYPVIMTSIYDNSVGAGYDQWGNSVTQTFTGAGNQTDEFGNVIDKAQDPAAGDWRGIVFQEYSNDRNVAIVLETEAATGVTSDANKTLKTAQHLGKLADNLYGGDENLRLGFDIHGTIHSDRTEGKEDVDVYSFYANAGTDIWIDMDLSRYALDAVIEILDSNGNVIARNNRSEDLTTWLSYTDMVSTELRNLSDKLGVTVDKIPAAQKLESNFRDTIIETLANQYYVQKYQALALAGLTDIAWTQAREDAVTQYGLLTGYNAEDGMYYDLEGNAFTEPVKGLSGDATSMDTDTATRNSLDDYGINEKDPGFHLNLPGAEGVQTLYYLRVTSNTNVENEMYDGKTYGNYEIQVRLRETQEKAGCTVQNAQIYYATNGIEVKGTPSASPLTVDTSDVEISITGSRITAAGTAENDTFNSAQNLGNILTTTQGSLSLTGYTAGNDIDWYKFSVSIPNLQNIPGVTDSSAKMYPLVIDIDYADGLGRADLNLWLYDSNGRLVASSSGSNITGDQATPFSGGDSTNLTGGSDSGSDPFIGTFYVPEGEYYLAVAPANMTPNALSQLLIRSESVDSVERIVEDNMAGGGLVALPVDNTYQLNFTPENYSLADVRMYIGTAGDLFSYNSYTGSYETDWTTNEANRSTIPLANDIQQYYGDYVMRSDGRLYAIDNRTGNLQEVSLEDARDLTTVNNLGIVTYVLGPNGLQRADNNNIGIDFDAIIFAHEDGTDVQYNRRPMFVVGSINANDQAIDVTQNLLYMINSDGTVHSLEGGSNDNGPNAGTQGVPISYLVTGRQLITPDGTNENDQALDIRDGHQITLDMTGDLDDVILEFDTGVDIIFDPLGGLAVRDGDTFTIGGTTFEFDSGPVLQIAANPTVANGDQIVVTWPGQNNTRTFIFQDSRLPEAERAALGNGQIGILFGANETSLTLTTKIVTAMTGAGVAAISGWDDVNENMFRDTDELGRISFNNINGLTVGLGQAGWIEQVATAGVTAGNVAIVYTEWTANDTVAGVNTWMSNFMQSICNTINNNVAGVEATYYHRPVTLNRNGNYVPSTGDRITIARLNAADFNAGDIADIITVRDNVLTNTPSSAGVTDDAQVIRIRVDADSTAAEISRRIEVAIEAFKLENRAYGNAINTTISGKNIMITVTGQINDMTSNAADVFQFEGDINGQGGTITGLAWVGDDLYAVTDTGDLFRVTYENGSMSNFDVRNVETGQDVDSDRYRYDPADLRLANQDAATTDWDILYEQRNNGNTDYYALVKNTARTNKFQLEYVTNFGADIQFQGLTNGPENAENEIYANLLFAVDTNGVVYCFDTDGNYMGIFSDGVSSVQTDCNRAIGIDFTTMDYNLWHQTNQRGGDAGHTLNRTLDNSRTGTTPGGTSFYFGLEDPRDGGEYMGTLPNSISAYLTNNGLYDTYNASGGTTGSMVSDEFSLKGISSSDQPIMTFDYFLDTEQTEIFDSFKIYIRCSDPNSTVYGLVDMENGNDINGAAYTQLLGQNSLANGQWILLGTNVDDDLGNNSTKVGVTFSDAGDGWHQAKISLGAYAGLSNLQLKLEFSTEGGNNVGDIGSVGELLYTTEAIDLNSGDKFAIDNINFTYDLGQKIVALNTPYARIADKEAGTTLEIGGNVIPVTCVESKDDAGVVYNELRVPIQINICESTTAVQLSNYVVEYLNAIIRESSSNASTTQQLLTAGGLVTEWGSMVGLDNGMEMTNGGGLFVNIGTDTLMFNDVPASIVHNVDPDNDINARAYTTEEFNAQIARLTMVDQTFAVTDVYGNVVTFLIVEEQGPAVDGVVQIVLAATDVTGDQTYNSLDELNNICNSINSNTTLIGVTAYVYENGIVIRNAQTVADVSGGITQTISRGNDAVGDNLITVSYNMTSNEVTTETATVIDSVFAPVVQTVANAPWTANAAFDQTAAITWDNVPFNWSTEMQTLFEQLENADDQWNQLLAILNLQGMTLPWVTSDAITNLVVNPTNISGLVASLKDGTATLWEVNAAYDNTQPITADNLPWVVNQAYATADDPTVPWVVNDLYDETLPYTFQRATGRLYDDDNNLIYASVKVNDGFEDQIHVINHVITSSGYLSASIVQWGDARLRLAAFTGAQPETMYAGERRLDSELNATPLHQIEGGQNNDNEGVYVDNFCIMLAGRGESYTAATADTTFSVNGVSPEGYYELNLRTGTDYGTYDTNTLTLTRTFRATDRLEGGLSIVVPEGESINHLTTFIIGDGNSEQRFVMVNDTSVDEAINAGTYADYNAWYAAQIANDVIRVSDVVIHYTPEYTHKQIASAIVSAVNSQYLATINDTTSRAFSVKAKSAQSSNRVDLYNATWIKGLSQAITDVSLEEMQYLNYGTEDATYQDYVNGDNQANDKGLLKGDNNVVSSQGQIILDSNLIAYSKEYGIKSTGNATEGNTLFNGQDVFQLNSKEDSTKTIYLDFTGHTTTGTGWNNGRGDIVTPAYDSNAELIYNVWLQVAEDYMPFDVNVTTVEPDAQTLASGGCVRVCIGGSWQDWFGQSTGGVAFLGSFNWNSDTPCFVFANNLGSAKNIGEAVSHEVGHTFGLGHDGDPTNEYYGGANGWAPIMGVGYSQFLVQWSKGEYAGATNKEDDLAIITNSIAYRDDDHGNSQGAATEVEIIKASSGVVASGIIETSKDFDWFKLTVAEDTNQWVTIGGIDLITNLDVGVQLYNVVGGVLKEITDPTIIVEDGLKFKINLTTLSGEYYISVTGTGNSANNSGDVITGNGAGATYSDYASLGAYTIDVQAAADTVTVEKDASNPTFPGFIVPFSTINDNRWVPSTVMSNNILAFNEAGGIYFGGNSNSLDNVGTVPFGRIVNNTVWGNGKSSGDTGITVGSNATATLLNNVVANCAVGIALDGSASSTIVNGYSAYYGNGVDATGGASIGANAIILKSGEQPFVSPDKLNFYPVEGSRIIDSSVNVLAQRAELDKVYNLLGISTSSIYAPDTDIYGQTRADDPSVQSSAGTGSNVYKDRGAVERIDWVGPVAALYNPVDLTTVSTKLTDDSDTNLNDVVLSGVTLSNFIIDFTDEGVGIDDDTVTSGSITVYKITSGYELDADGNFIDAKLAFENGSDYVEKLSLTYDYLFKYNATLDRITLIPVTGSWQLGFTYQIELDSDPTSSTCIYDLAGNELQPNRTEGTMVGRTLFNISLSGMNYGDAPDGAAFPDYNYHTLQKNLGAAHTIIPGFSLGQTVTATADAVVNKDATASSDDDGVEFLFKDAMLKRGVDNTLTVTVRNDAVTENGTIAGYVCIWIDVDGDGEWNSASGNDFFLKQEVYVGANDITIDANALQAGVDETFMRVRLFSVETADAAFEADGVGINADWYAGSLNPDGTYKINPVVRGGEVEDYKVYLVDEYYDYGDAVKSYGSVSHVVDNTNGDYIYLGKVDDGISGGVDAELIQHYSNDALGDDNYGKLNSEGKVIDDENGVVFNLDTLTPGVNAEMTVSTSNTTGNGYLYVWIDFNQDGKFNADECIVNGKQISETGTTVVTSDTVVPEVNGNFSTAARVRYSATQLTGVGTEVDGVDQGSVGFGGAAATRGEVEDYQVIVSSIFYDYGDAPDTYGTLKSSNGAYHQLTNKDVNGNRVCLGTTVTSELDGQPSVKADADSGDDGLSVNEDTGYVNLTMTPGKTVQLPVTVTGSGYLQIWVDYNGNGVFDTNERVSIDSISQEVGGTYEKIAEKFKNSTWGYKINGGNIESGLETSELLVTFTIPTDAAVGETFMRVRFYEETIVDYAAMQPLPTGFGYFGEVEDYLVNIQNGKSIIEGYKFNDANANGIWDVNVTSGVVEVGIKGIAVYLDANNNGKWDTTEEVSVTDASGYYCFENLVSGTYIVREIFSKEDIYSYVDGEESNPIVNLFETMYPSATLYDTSEAKNWIQTYPQRVASIPENDASNPNATVEEKTFTFAFKNEGNVSLDGCKIYLTNYPTNYEDGAAVEYTFEITTTKDKVSLDSTTIYVYYDASKASPMNELAKAFAEAVNKLSKVGFTAKSVDNRVEIVSGVYDLRVSNGGTDKLLPTEDISWLKITSSHSMPNADSTANSGGYHVVIVSKEGTYSGVNFGNYRKPEVSVGDGIYGEGSTGGWIPIEIPIEITKSFGSEIVIRFSTEDGTAIGYVGDPNSQTDLNAAANAGADFIHTDGEVVINIDQDQIKGGDWEATQITYNSTDDNYETKVAGDYIIFRRNEEIYYYNITTGLDPVAITDDNCDDAYLDAAVLPSGDVVATWSKYNKETKKWQLYYHFIEGGSTTADEHGTLINLPEMDYYSPVLGEDCLYFMKANFVNGSTAQDQTLMMINNFDSVKNSSGNVYPTEVYKCKTNETIMDNSVHVNSLTDGVVFNVKDSTDGSIYIYYKANSDATTKPVCLTAQGSYCTNPQIDGDYIVWEQTVNGTGMKNIMLYTISTGTTEAISSVGPYTSDTTTKKFYTNNVTPAIDNGTIVWAGEVFNQETNVKTTEILVYNIADATTTQISQGGSCAVPSIKDGQIAWTQEITLTSGVKDREIYVYNLDTLKGPSPIYAPDATTGAGRLGNDWDPTVCADGVIIWRGMDKKSEHYELFITRETEPYYIENVVVWVYADTIVEPDEFFYVNIETSAEEVIINNERAQIWLLNDDSTHTDKQSMDYGDAPDRYPVLLANNGARHDVSGYRLGTNISYEKAAKSNAAATGDNYDDGVAALSGGNKEFVPGMVYSLTVNATVPTSDADGKAYLDAWIDFNGDGLWSDNERIADSFAVVNGENTLSFLVPYTTFVGETFARFRLSADGGLDSTGYASTGEVEDYKVVLTKNLSSTTRSLVINGDNSDENYVFAYTSFDENGVPEKFTISRTINGETRYAYVATGIQSWVETETELNVADYDLIKINGSTGTNTIQFTGSSSAEIYKVYQSKVFIYSNGLNINIEGMATMNIDTAGGADTVNLLGSRSTDAFVVGEHEANVGLVVDKESFVPYYTVSNLDSAAMIYCYGDADQGDTADISTVEGVACEAKFDRNDLVISELTGGVIRKAIGFDAITARSVNADDTVVFLYADKVKIPEHDPIAVTGYGYANFAYGFDYANIHSASTSSTFKMTAGNGGDLVISPDGLSFAGTTGRITATGFSNVEFDGNNQDISAAMYDSVDNDVVTMYANNVQMKGQNYLNVIKNVKFVNAYSTAGGKDVAKIYDTVGVDYLYAQAYSTTIFDQEKTFSNTATGFAQVLAYSTNSAQDKAYLYDSVGNDTLVSTSAYTSISGKTFNNKVYGFNTVNVSSVNGGNDVARLYDSAVNDILSAGNDWAQIESVDLSINRKVSNFSLVEAIAANSGNKTIKDSDKAVDFILNTYGNWDDND